MNTVHFSSKTPEWATPQNLFDELDKEFHFTLDSCATPENAKCKRFFTKEQDGLKQSWDNEIVFCNHCNIDCGITENSVSLYHGYKNMFEMQFNKECQSEEFSSKQENDEWIGFLVQKMPSRGCENKDAKISENTRENGKDIDSKEKTSTKREGYNDEKEIIENIESQKKTESNECSVGMDNTGLGKLQIGLDEQVCLLRKKWGLNPRSFYSSNGQEMPWDSSRKYGSSMYVLQHKQTAQRSILVVQKPGHTCPNCGLPTIIKKNVVFVNPPYGRELPKWVKKASEAEGGSVVMLIPARTDTRYFHEYIYGKAEIRFLKGRLKFGDSKNSAPFPSMIVVFRGNNI